MALITWWIAGFALTGLLGSVPPVEPFHCNPRSVCTRSPLARVKAVNPALGTIAARQGRTRARASAPTAVPTTEVLLRHLADVEREVSVAVGVLDLTTARAAVADHDTVAAQANFWDNPAAAKAAIRRTEVHRAALALADGWAGAAAECRAALDLAADLADGSVGDGDGSAGRELRAEAAARLEGLGAALVAWRTGALLSGPYDACDCRLVITAGAGGVDAQDWAEVLERMYGRWAARRGFSVDVVERSGCGEGQGIRSVELELRGARAFGLLAGEKGTHRLVRVSPFNGLGKRQTSFAGVEVTPVLRETEFALLDEMSIPDNDLSVSFMRSGGAGGQNVNKVESGVLLRHMPSGLTARCTQERSQLQNRAIALKRLKEKLMVVKREQNVAAMGEIRGDAVEATFGEQIRSYVLHPYKLAKDSRSGAETGDVKGLLEGGPPLDDFLAAHLRWRASRREGCEERGAHATGRATGQEPLCGPTGGLS